MQFACSLVLLAAGSRPVILLAVGHEVRRYVSDAKEYDYNDAVITGRRIQALAVDSERQVIYWTDTSDKSIRRAMMPSDTKHQAHSQDIRAGGDIMAPYGIAFDWVAK
jgi:hypothetical protein